MALLLSIDNRERKSPGDLNTATMMNDPSSSVTSRNWDGHFQ
jgi:hypothetical protein